MSRTVFLGASRRGAPAAAHGEPQAPDARQEVDLSLHPAEEGAGAEYARFICALGAAGAYQDEAFAGRVSRWLPVRLYGAVTVDVSQEEAEALVCLAGDLFDACPELLEEKVAVRVLEALRGFAAATELGQRQLESVLAQALGVIHEAQAAEFSGVFEAAVLGSSADFGFCFEYLSRANCPDVTARFLAAFDTRRLPQQLHQRWWRLARTVCWKAGGEDEAAIRDRARWLEPSQAGEQWLEACGICL